MANGFITLENGQDFVTRWTGYDLILEIAVVELSNHGYIELASWLKTRLPDGEDKGDAVFWNSAGEMIERSLDLRALTRENRALFWKALTIGNENLFTKGELYSTLNPERLHELLQMHDSVQTDMQ